MRRVPFPPLKEKNGDDKSGRERQNYAKDAQTPCKENRKETFFPSATNDWIERRLRMESLGERPCGSVATATGRWAGERE